MILRRYITHCDGVPAPTSPISHAVSVGDTCWISGQHSLDIDGTYCAGTAAEEASRCFELLLRIGKEAGFGVEDVVFVDICFVDLSDLDCVNRAFEKVCGGQTPGTDDIPGCAASIRRARKIASGCLALNNHFLAE